MTNQKEMKFCQSCGMPLMNEEVLGTNKDGAFLANCTMEEMIDSCAPICVREGGYPDEETAKREMLKFFPQLKRWKK